MAIPILMPKLSFVVTQGTIIEWLKQPGEMVTKGEPLVVVEQALVDHDVGSGHDRAGDDHHWLSPGAG